MSSIGVAAGAASVDAMRVVSVGTIRGRCCIDIVVVGVGVLGGEVPTWTPVRVSVAAHRMPRQVFGGYRRADFRTGRVCDRRSVSSSSGMASAARRLVL